MELCHCQGVLDNVFDGCMARMPSLISIAAEAMGGPFVHHSTTVAACVGLAQRNFQVEPHSYAYHLISFRPLSTRTLRALKLRDLNLVYTDWSAFNYCISKTTPTPIIFLPIGDNLGPLGNVRCAVSVQTLCLRTSINIAAVYVEIYRHAHSAHVELTTYVYAIRFMRKAFRVRLQELYRIIV